MMSTKHNGNNSTSNGETQFNINDQLFLETLLIYNLSHDVASGSGITPCNKIDKPLVV